MAENMILRQMMNQQFQGIRSSGRPPPPPNKMARPNFRSRNRPWDLMLQVEEEEEDKNETLYFTHF
jgi:hypothetical protein